MEPHIIVEGAIARDPADRDRVCGRRTRGEICEVGGKSVRWEECDGCNGMERAASIHSESMNA
jgi:hypothetical protein